MQHLVLIGDSVLDNHPYVAPEPDTTEHLRASLGAGWKVELLARDGSTMPDLKDQLAGLPTKAEVAVLSIGGNDALADIDILDERSTSSVKLFNQMLVIADAFALRYRASLDLVRQKARRLVVCTIYEPPLTDPATARLARVPLSLLNDQILREAMRAGVDVLDLRAVCTLESDFVQEIEPSPAGAKKIAVAIRGVLLPDSHTPSVRLFAV